MSETPEVALPDKEEESLVDDEISLALDRITKALPHGGERRHGQVDMARAAYATMRNNGVLCVQAGTGTGKSLGYAVPAILSGKRVVVATATKALQDQLADRDLPFVRDHLGIPFEFAVLKGRNNYVCLQRVEETQRLDRLDLEEAGPPSKRAAATTTLSEGEQVKQLMDWAKKTETGDRAQLSFEPSPRVWAQMSVTAEECPGAAKCDYGESCFAEKARSKATNADLIVTNQHLYAAHVASGGFVLPDHEVIVFDEAHEIDDIFSKGLGKDLSTQAITQLTRSAKRLALKNIEIARKCESLDNTAMRLSSAFAGFIGQRITDKQLSAVQPLLISAAEQLSSLMSSVRSITLKNDDEPLRQRFMQAASGMAALVASLAEPDKGRVCWAEGSSGNPILRVAPLNLADALGTHMWPNVESAILTSATMPSNAAKQLGLPEHTKVLDVGSPFDYRKNALLYVAKHLPDPRTTGNDDAILAEIVELVTIAGGRTLVLCTSRRMLEASAAALRDHVDTVIYAQDDLPKPALIEAFTNDETSSLVATMGFWQGVDVPGSSLSMVIIDKLPFPRPDDPLLSARRDQVGPAAFSAIDLPRAATLLAQGTGRLIRTATDRGVIAVLDARLAKAGYRNAILNALPPMKRSISKDEVRSFLSDSASD